MSNKNSENIGAAEEDDELSRNNKINPISKLYIIHALDNGQSKAFIAREYGVRPETIAYIYKQKEFITKKYSQKYSLLKEVLSAKLDQTLLNWLEVQIKCGNSISEETLRKKTVEILHTLSKGFSCIDDWLLDFRRRHSLEKFNLDTESNLEDKKEWQRLHSGFDFKDVYVGGISTILHTLDFETFVSGQRSDEYVSLLYIVNSTGLDKKELAIAGKVPLDTGRSLPAVYYLGSHPQLNSTTIHHYLNTWNNDLKSKGQNVMLALSIPPNFLKILNFSNIQLVNSSNMVFVSKALEKIEACFKYHYRRLQMMKLFDRTSGQMNLFDYIHLISLAWYNVNSNYIQHIFWPPEEGSLYFNLNGVVKRNHSLSQWCILNNIPIGQGLYSLVDEFVSCDNQLHGLDLEQSNNQQNDTKNVLKIEDSQSPSGSTEAYQAMKRLVSYLQSIHADRSIIQSAKFLENHVEYGVLKDIHDIVACTNESNDSE